MALTKATYSMIGGAVVNVFDYMTQEEIDDVTSRTASIDVTSKIQAAIDSQSTGLTVFLPRGTYKTTSTIYLRRSGVHIIGTGPGSTEIKYVNASGGIVFSGDTDKTASLEQYESCSLENFEVIRSDPNAVTAAANDPQIVVDLTSFSYSYFNIEAQVTRPYATIFYGQGNNGQSPYYNRIESTGLFGGADYTQIAFQFAGGAWAGGSNGPNANMIGPITRVVSVATVFDIQAGQGNMFSQIGAESVAGTFILLGNNAYTSSGTSSGSNGAYTFIDSSKSWTSQEFVNGAVQIISGTGAGQIRRVSGNNATTLTLEQPWATIPDATSQYQVFPVKCANNKFVNIRQEGLGTSNFVFAWPDSRDTEIDHASVQSAGGYLDDRSCSPGNKFYGQSRSFIHHEFITPGAGADINAFIKNSVLGGLKFAGQYVIDWVFVETTSASHADYADVVVDCGGSTVGSGSPTLGLRIPDGESAGCAMVSGSRVAKFGENVGVFLNLKTGPSFSAGVSVTVTIAVTLTSA